MGKNGRGHTLCTYFLLWRQVIRCEAGPVQQLLTVVKIRVKITGSLLPLPFLVVFQQVASQTVKTRPPSFSMGAFQGTPSSFSPMTAPGSTASPSGTAYPNLASRGTGFSEYSLWGWGGWWSTNKISSE